MPATPFSYRQYAGNGSTTSFSVPFPYLLKAHVKVYLGFNILNGTFSSELANGVGFNWSSGTQITCATAPASGQTLTVIRLTPSDSRLVDWQDGSNLIADNLDTADLQNLYVVQEQQDRNDAAVTQSTSAQTAATAATAASAAATAAAATATTASTTATATANTALSQSSSALSQSATALSTAAAASTSAANAASTAASASTAAASAVTTANAADAKANSAITAISTSAVFTPVANVAAIPSSPAGGQAIQVTDSTGIQSFTPLSGLPPGFTGDAGISARIQYNAATSGWVWYGYFASDSDARYLKLSGGTLTGPVTIPAGSSISGYLTTATAASTYLATSAIGSTVQAYNANTAVTNAVQSFTAAQRGSYVTLTDAATVAIDLSLSNNYQVTLGGNRTIGAPSNVVAGQSGVIRLVQDATGSRTASWNSVFKFPGGTAPTLTTTANAVDLVAYHVESATRIAARFIGDVK